MIAHALTGGFADAPRDAARAFRAVLDAMAHPGRIVTIAGAQPPAPLSLAAGTVLLTLADPTTPIHLAPGLDSDAARDWLAFHSGAPITGPQGATFALGTWAALMPLGRFPAGTPEYPDRSATLIVEVETLLPVGCRLHGPGIKGSAALSLPEEAAFAANHARFPLGLDFILTCGNRLACLPRSTQVEGAACMSP